MCLKAFSLSLIILKVHIDNDDLTVSTGQLVDHVHGARDGKMNAKIDIHNPSSR